MSGSLTHRYDYSPYGEGQAQSEGTHNPLRFAARELDASTGMYYVRARWYDPFLGRFLSEDPIGLAGGNNQYAYAGNDPVNFTDPTGLQRECIVRGFHHFRRVGDGPWEYTETEITYMYCTQEDTKVPHHRQFDPRLGPSVPVCDRGSDNVQCEQTEEELPLVVSFRNLPTALNCPAELSLLDAPLTPAAARRQGLTYWELNLTETTGTRVWTFGKVWDTRRGHYSGEVLDVEGIRTGRPGAIYPAMATVECKSGTGTGTSVIPW